MIPGITTIGEPGLPPGVLPAAHRQYVDSLLPLLMADPDAELVFVLKATPPPSRPATGYALPYAIGSEPLGVLSPADPPAPATIWLADEALQTDPDDTPANTIMRPLLANPLNFEQSLARDGSGAEASGGVIELDNPDGVWEGDHDLPPGLLDDLLGRAWKGWGLELYVGGTFNVGRASERTLKVKEYGLLFRGTAAAKSAGQGRITIAPADPMVRLETVLNPETFAGTGGIEGGADVAGLNKPYAAGGCCNIPGIPLDPLLGLFFFAIGPLFSFDEVRVRGVPLTIGADYPTYEALASAVVAAGTFASCKALGIGRCGGTLDGQPTADVRGDASGAGYVSTPGALVRRLVTARGAAPLRDPDEIDAVAFAALESAAPYTMNLYTGTAPTLVSDAIRLVMADVGGYVVMTPDGRLTVGLDDGPAPSPVATDTDKTIGEHVEVEYEDPVSRWQLGYRRNWTVQPADSLGLIADDLRLQYSSAEKVTKPAESIGLLVTYPLAAQRFASTLLVNEADANAVRDRLLARDGRGERRYITYELLRPLFQARLGETRAIQHHSHGLSAGVNGLVVGLGRDVGGRVETITLRTDN